MATPTSKTNSIKLVKSREDSSSSKPKTILSPDRKISSSSSSPPFSSPSNKQLLDSKNKSLVSASKSEAKGKTTSNSSKTVTKTATVKGRKTEKKVYTLPGQKYDPPEEREPLRIFYESLSKQIPSSEMAEFWMMEHGLLSPERAKKAYDRKQKRQQQQRMGTPVKTTTVRIERPESSQKLQSSKNGELKPKKKINYKDDDDDFVIKTKKSRG